MVFFVKIKWVHFTSLSVKIILLDLDYVLPTRGK